MAITLGLLQATQWQTHLALASLLFMPFLLLLLWRKK